jgi:hypothetical protein
VDLVNGWRQPFGHARDGGDVVGVNRNNDVIGRGYPLAGGDLEALVGLG